MDREYLIKTMQRGRGGMDPFSNFGSPFGDFGGSPFGDPLFIVNIMFYVIGFSFFFINTENRTLCTLLFVSNTQWQRGHMAIKEYHFFGRILKLVSNRVFN